ncbi:MAG: glycosyltransferase, partial [Acetobacteraceae bacterium]
GHGQTPTHWQRSIFPAWARKRLEVVPEGADLGLCRPRPELRRRLFTAGEIRVQPGEKLVTYVARNLEPYRGFHTMMRALPRVLSRRTDARAVVVGGDEVSYGMRPEGGGTWRERLLREVGGRLDLTRVHFPGKLEYRHYLALLQRSDVHVYLTYPFVASWSLREAMAVGAPIVASDTLPVREFIRDRSTGLLTPCLDPARLAERILELLEDLPLAQRLGAAARRYAQTHLTMENHIATYHGLIARLLSGA